MRGCAGSAPHLSNPRNLFQIMQIIRPPPGNVSYVTQIRNVSALKHLDHEL